MAYGTVNADVIGTSTANANLGAKNASTLQNRLIDAGFTINQRGYTSGTSLSSGSYGHDRWKAGSGGCTYTFTQLSTGVPIVITITAGSLQQVIEGCNMPEGGTYVLSWQGTAQARFNGGTYGSSPLAVTGLTAGSNCTIEFNTGTCSFAQLEVGSSATGFEYRQYQQELALCQRYYWRNYDPSGTSAFIPCGTGYIFNTTTGTFQLSLPVTMRTRMATINFSNVRVYSAGNGAGGVVTSVSGIQSTNTVFQADVGVGSAIFAGGAPGALQGNSNTAAYAEFSAEL